MKNKSENKIKNKTKFFSIQKENELVDTLKSVTDWGYNYKILSCVDYLLLVRRQIPSLVSYSNIDIKLIEYLKENYQILSNRKAYDVDYRLNEDKTLFVKDDVAISIDISSTNPNVLDEVKIAYPYNSEVDLSFMEKYVILNKKSNIGIFIKNEMGELTVKKLNIKNYNMEDLDLYYGDGFSKIHDKILKSITNDESGLYIFNGKPGTGKSSYIRHLSSLISNKGFIYIPEFMAKSLSSPDIIEILLENKGSILILEDAENLIKSRDESQDNMVSTILNLTDGLLSDLLNVKIIVTYNTEKIDVDKALLRKSRLKYKHEFNPLSIDNAKKLINKLKINYTVKNEMTVAEIFKANEDYGVIEKKENKSTLGFE